MLVAEAAAAVNADAATSTVAARADADSGWYVQCTLSSHTLYGKKTLIDMLCVVV